ncbi:MAG: hypothetical protein JSS53_02490 [Proteobacteria bacterium]|nr:hypothetical protein [Pseudomonadota bacterium]
MSWFLEAAFRAVGTLPQISPRQLKSDIKKIIKLHRKNLSSNLCLKLTILHDLEEYFTSNNKPKDPAQLLKKLESIFKKTLSSSKLPSFEIPEATPMNNSIYLSSLDDSSPEDFQECLESILDNHIEQSIRDKALKKLIENIHGYFIFIQSLETFDDEMLFIFQNLMKRITAARIHESNQLLFEYRIKIMLHKIYKTTELHPLLKFINEIVILCNIFYIQPKFLYQIYSIILDIMSKKISLSEFKKIFDIKNSNVTLSQFTLALKMINRTPDSYQLYQPRLESDPAFIKLNLLIESLLQTESKKLHVIIQKYLESHIFDDMKIDTILILLDILRETPEWNNLNFLKEKAYFLGKLTSILIIQMKANPDNSLPIILSTLQKIISDSQFATLLPSELITTLHLLLENYPTKNEYHFRSGKLLIQAIQKNLATSEDFLWKLNFELLRLAISHFCKMVNIGHYLKKQSDISFRDFFNILEDTTNLLFLLLKYSSNKESLVFADVLFSSRVSTVRESLATVTSTPDASSEASNESDTSGNLPTQRDIEHAEIIYPSAKVSTVHRTLVTRNSTSDASSEASSESHTSRDLPLQKSTAENTEQIDPESRPISPAPSVLPYSTPSVPHPSPLSSPLPSRPHPWR